MDPYLEIQMSEDEREYNKRRMATPSGTEGSAEPFTYEQAMEMTETINILRQRLQDAQKEILRLKEEVKIVVGICASDTLPRKEK